MLVWWFNILLLAQLPLLCPVSCKTRTASQHEGRKTRTRRIINGNVIEIEDAPYQAAIYNSGRFIASGAIISSEQVVTTAWYIQGIPAENLTISIGSAYNNVTKYLIPVKEYFIHPKFQNGSFNFDVCTIKTAVEIPFDVTIRPIELQQVGSPHPEGNLAAYISGWGTKEDGRVDHVLRQAEIYFVDWNACKMIYGDLVTETMTCGGERSSNACLGDYGDPIVLKENLTLAALVSAPQDCLGDPDFPSIFVHLANPEVRAGMCLSC